MSMFPSVGSTVTKVVANKTGTVAKVEFDDGTSLLVKYEALVIDLPVSDNTANIQHESKVIMSGGINAKTKSKVNRPAIPQKSSTPVMNESAYKELASKVLKRQETRQDQIFKEWEKETGQFDHAAGPMQ